jgi:hypothetical protein
VGERHGGPAGTPAKGASTIATLAENAAHPATVQKERLRLEWPA